MFMPQLEPRLDIPSILPDKRNIVFKDLQIEPLFIPNLPGWDDQMNSVLLDLTYFPKVTTRFVTITQSNP